MHKKNIIIFSIFLYIFSLAFTYADFSNLSNEKIDCLNLIKNEYKDLDLEKSNFTNSVISVNDWLTWLNFWLANWFTWVTSNQQDIFSSENYYYWEKSNLLKKDFYKNLELYTDYVDDTVFYEKELNFNNIKKDSKEKFLSCSLSFYNSLIWNFTDLKNSDTYTTYKPYPETYSIEEIKYNWNKWKKVTLSNIYKDKLWKKDTFKKESVYFIPYNKNLQNYYNLFEISKIYWDMLNFFKKELQNKLNYKSNFKEIYNDKNWIVLSRYDFWENKDSDKYWIKYLLLNWINHFVDYNELRRHKIFEYLLKSNSPLVKNLYSFEYKPNERKSSKEDFVFWINYSLWNLENINKSEIFPSLYYENLFHISKKNYYKVSDKVSWDDYSNYITSQIYNSNDEDLLLKNIKKITLDDNFSYLLKQHDLLVEEYNNIKNVDSENERQVKWDFIKKYKDIFPNDDIFTKQDYNVTNTWKLLDNKNSIINNKNLNFDKKIQDKKNIIILWILLIIVLVLFFIPKKKLKK